MRFGWTAQDSFKRTLWLAYLLCTLYLLMYVVIYQVEPFSEFWNIVLTNLLVQVASLATAMMALSIWRLYEKADRPRHVWSPFTIALFLWFIAELSWGYLNVTQGEVPVGLPDLFWVTAYPAFGLALFFQYQIVAQATPRDSLIRILIVVLFVMIFTTLTYFVMYSITESSYGWSAAINFFYPVADFALAVIAFRMARRFSGGAFSRPWMGLLVFAGADLIYAWLQISGLYTWSIDQGNLLTTVSDTVYLGAYLVMLIALLYQRLFLKYGMRPQ